METERHKSTPSTQKPYDTSGAGSVRKRLFVFCDGTWQDGVNNKRPLTNVATLARSLEGVADDNYLQIVYYDNGVGNTTSLPTHLVDGATGRGISAKIRNAYSFLSHNYNFDDENDEIFLVGFSRGAFTVQCLASFISQTGLFRKQHLYYLRGLFTLWANQHFEPLLHPGKRPVEKSLADHLNMFESLKLSTKVKIKACIVWDTVSNLGLPRPWAKPMSFVGSVIPKAVENAFQALALDETRAQFKPCVWNSKQDENTFVKQCWFLGSHTDIGGNGDAALGAVTLIWMIAQLQGVSRVKFNKDEVAKHLKHRFLEWDVDMNPILGQLKQRAILSHRSSSGRTTKSSPVWWLSGFKPRTIYSGTATDNPELDTITSVHFTVRLSMVHNRTKCRVLRGWKTTLKDGYVHWEKDGEVLSEEILQGSSIVFNHGYAILRRWFCDELPLLPTDRSKFAVISDALVHESQEGPGSGLGWFAAFI